MAVTKKLYEMLCLLIAFNSFVEKEKKPFKHSILCQHLFSTVKVLNNLAKAASEEYLKENHVLEYALEVSQLPNDNPCDQATMRYTEGVLM